jgi:hypothetical protein
MARTSNNNDEATKETTETVSEQTVKKQAATAPKTKTATKLIYAGPSIARFGLVSGATYSAGRPKHVPEELHFAFVPIAEYKTKSASGAFKQRLADALKKINGGK